MRSANPSTTDDADDRAPLLQGQDDDNTPYLLRNRRNDDDDNDNEEKPPRGRRASTSPPLTCSSPSSSSSTSNAPSNRHGQTNKDDSTMPLPTRHHGRNSSSSHNTISSTSLLPLPSRPRSPLPPHLADASLASARARRRADARRRYTYAAFFLVTSLVSFTVQTVLASYIQHELGWNKAYCMLWLTHSSWVLLWPLQLVVLRLRRREVPWRRFWEGHVRLLRGVALVVETRDLKGLRGLAGGSGVGGQGEDADGDGSGGGGGGGGNGLLEYGHSPWRYLARTTVVVTTALTVAGLSWYVAVSMTTPSDLTAIYNCSAFFAYAFSVPLLKERLRLDKMFAVAVAIAGVMVVAYGDNEWTQTVRHGSAGDAVDPGARFIGNLVIGAGSVLYGLYEVLYKRLACPPDGTDATKGVIFANTFGSLIGAFTLLVLWIPMPLLHVLGWETFEMPTGQTARLLFISVVANMVFSGSFLVLISLTSPVLSSVAALLTIFIVGIADWYLNSTPLTTAGIIGGLLIVAAFAMLSWSTWREMNEEERKAPVDLGSDDEED